MKLSGWIFMITARRKPSHIPEPELDKVTAGMCEDSVLAELQCHFRSCLKKKMAVL